jgi:hypothetical protein
LLCIQIEGCVGESMHDRRDFLSTVGGTGKEIEALETDEGVEDIDGLIDGLGGGSPVLLGDAPDDDTKTVPPPFISRSYDLLEIGVEGG